MEGVKLSASEAEFSLSEIETEREMLPLRGRVGVSGSVRVGGIDRLREIEAVRGIVRELVVGNEIEGVMVTVLLFPLFGAEKDRDAKKTKVTSTNHTVSRMTLKVLFFFFWRELYNWRKSKPGRSLFSLPLIAGERTTAESSKEKKRMILALQAENRLSGKKIGN